MRKAFHEQIDLLIDDLARLTLMVEACVVQATAALLDADAQEARRVVRGGEQLATLVRDLDERSLILAAREQPVARDLRAVVAAFRITADLERMGQLAVHVAEAAARSYPDAVVPAELRQTVADMGRVAQTCTAEVAGALTARDWRAAARLSRGDDEMDALEKSLYRRVLDRGWPHGVETAVDAALIGRYFERYADHAVAVAHRIAFVAGREPLDEPLAPVAPPS
jgi:phosphate transport system protein